MLAGSAIALVTYLVLSVLGTAGNMVGKGLLAASSGIAAATDAATNPAQAGDQVKEWFERVIASGEPALNAADKEALVNFVAARTGKSKKEATQIVDNYGQAYQQAMQKVEELKQQAEQKAREVAAKQVSRAAWSTLAMLLLGGGAELLCGTYGAD